MQPRCSRGAAEVQPRCSRVRGSQSHAPPSTEDYSRGGEGGDPVPRACSEPSCERGAAPSFLLSPPSLTDPPPLRRGAVPPFPYGTGAGYIFSAKLLHWAATDAAVQRWARRPPQSHPPFGPQPSHHASSGARRTAPRLPRPSAPCPSAPSPLGSLAPRLPRPSAPLPLGSLAPRLPRPARARRPTPPPTPSAGGRGGGARPRGAAVAKV